jgi:ribosome-associated protein
MELSGQRHRAPRARCRPKIIRRRVNAHTSSSLSGGRGARLQAQRVRTARALRGVGQALEVSPLTSWLSPSQPPGTATAVPARRPRPGRGPSGPLGSGAGQNGEVPRSPILDVPLSGDPIRVGQFLKLAGLAEHGAHAKELLEAGEVQVNGRVETRRGARLRTGDVVAVQGRRARPVARAAG